MRAWSLFLLLLRNSDVKIHPPSSLPWRKPAAVSAGVCTAPCPAHKWLAWGSECPLPPSAPSLPALPYPTTAAPTACLLPFLSSLQGPHSDLAHTTSHAGTLWQQEQSCSPFLLAWASPSSPAGLPAVLCPTGGVEDGVQLWPRCTSQSRGTSSAASRCIVHELFLSCLSWSAKQEEFHLLRQDATALM